VKFVHAVFDICERTDRHTDKLIATLRTLPGRSKSAACLLIYSLLYHVFRLSASKNFTYSRQLPRSYNTIHYNIKTCNEPYVTRMLIVGAAAAAGIKKNSTGGDSTIMTE